MSWTSLQKPPVGDLGCREGRGWEEHGDNDGMAPDSKTFLLYLSKYIGNHGNEIAMGF